MLRRRVRVCEHYRIPWEPKNLLKRYEFYDQSRDSMFYLSWHNLWKASFPPTGEAHENTQQAEMKESPVGDFKKEPDWDATFVGWGLNKSKT
jgi:hypothetical protein